MRGKAICGVAALLLAAGMAGCGTPGAPQPPSLNLPMPVSDLSATRAGDQVTLRWTMPRRTTDKLLMKAPKLAIVCLREGSGACVSVHEEELKPSAAATWTGALPAELAAGEPRAVRYFVEVRNEAGRSAGLGNAAVVLAGAAPAPVADLTSELEKDGVALRWAAANDGTAVRLKRKLLTPSAKKETGLLGEQKQPAEVQLLVKGGSEAGGALDKAAERGAAYEYRAQRVAQVTVDGETLELAGELSEPLRVEVKDIFPPDAPKGLVAVASQAADGSVSIDLSWQPNSEEDLAGYAVYRREGDAAWQKVSPAKPVVGPAFHDTQVQAGHTYSYAVTAVDRGGRESERSAAAAETTPGN